MMNLSQLKSSLGETLGISSSGDTLANNDHDHDVSTNGKELRPVQQQQQPYPLTNNTSTSTSSTTTTTPVPPFSPDLGVDYGYKYEYQQQQQQEAEEEGDVATAQQITNNNLGMLEHDYFEDTAASSCNNNNHMTKKNDYRSMALMQSTAYVTQDQQNLAYIFLLGKTYHPVVDYPTRKTYENSLFWFTYRCHFDEIVPYGITTDAGWGCMLRSAQMLLAQTLRCHFQSPSWKPPTSITKHRADPFTKSLLTWFADFASKTVSVYSLHNMVAAGMAYEKLPGEWYGPTAAAYVLRDLVDLHAQSQPSLFRVVVSSEGTIYRHSVHDRMTQDAQQKRKQQQSSNNKKQPKVKPTPITPLHPLADPNNNTSTTTTANTKTKTSGQDDDNDDNIIDPSELEWDTSLLLLVPLRLGLDKIQPEYFQGIAKTFWMSQSVGILGGRPRGARWFYGAYADGSHVLGLDPHTIHAAPTRFAETGGIDLSDDYIRSVHTSYPEVYPLPKMDPSIVLGFYCRNKKEFAYLEQEWNRLQQHLIRDAATAASSNNTHTKNARPPAPLFTFAERPPPDYYTTTTTTTTTATTATAGLSSAAMDDMLLGDDDDDDEVGDFASPGAAARATTTNPKVVVDDDDDDDFVLL